MNKNVEICDGCGRKIVTYKHKLSMTQVRCLYALYKHHGSGKASALGLANKDYSNMSKLVVFGFAYREGYVYHITDLGIKFLSGKAKAPSAVYTRLGSYVGEDSSIYISQIKDYSQPREDWLEQASLY